jgi:hypothetical protein
MEWIYLSVWIQEIKWNVKLTAHFSVVCKCLNVLPMRLRGMLLNYFNNNNYNLLLHGSYFKVKSVEAIVISRDASRELFK